MNRRTARNRPRKLPKESRTIPQFGDPVLGGGEDANVWYRCWVCSQLNSTETSTLGGSDSLCGVAYEDYADIPEVYSDGIGTAVMGGMSNTFTAQLNASDGNPIGVINSIRVSDSGTGCKFCGSKNWRGDHP